MDIRYHHGSVAAVVSAVALVVLAVVAAVAILVLEDDDVLVVEGVASDSTECHRAAINSSMIVCSSCSARV